MKIKDLIHQLSLRNPEADVLISDMDGGYYDLITLNAVKVILHENAGTYYPATKDTPNTIVTICLE